MRLSPPPRSSRQLLHALSVICLAMGLHVHAIAQPGTCILGDRIHNNLRIINQDGAQNVQCFDCLTNPPNVLLDLIHKYKPVIRLASNFDGGGCLGRSGTLSLHKNDGPRYSQEESEYDLALVASEKINNLLLSTRNHTASIKFATTPELNAPDVERMRITPKGHVGIDEKNPNEILQLWKRMTFHVGFEDDYIGYNVFRDATYKPDGTVDRQFDRLVNVGQPFNAPPLKLGMSRYGYLELGAGAVSGQNSEVDWYEGGGTFDGFAGLTLRNIDGKACASLGNYYPWQDTRLLIKAFTRTTATTNALTNALVVLSSENTDLLRVRNDGNVGIARANPMERLHIGDLITVHDGGGKFLGFNTYYNPQSRRLENIQGGRASVTIGVGDAVSNPSVFAIKIDQSQNIGPVMTSFKGLSMNTTGNVGIGVESPTARLDVLGSASNNSNIFVARGLSNTGSKTFFIVTSDGNVGVNTQTPKSTLHVQGDVTIGINQCTNAHPGFSNKLSVDGIIFTKEVRVVPSTWADDVFRSEYCLPTLKQVEDHIKKHGHLQGIPSEAQATTDGIDVSVMQAALLRKVEELTLYVIELEKKVARLSTESNGEKP